MKVFIVLFFINMILYAQDLIEYDYELDAYYSNVSAFIDLDKNKEIKDGTNLSETDIYKDLFFHTFSPNIFLIEASIHPMGIAGAYFRANHEDLYNKGVTNGFNMVKALTAGFEEPYSVSFFIGRMMVFKKQHQDHIGKNRAYMGTLLTISDKSIKDNKVYSDKWALLEFKLKGTREKKIRDLDWSFRIGGCFHNNHDFVDTLYIGARRSSIDYTKNKWSFIYNIAYNAMIAVDATNFNFTDAEFSIEKKWPISANKKISFGIIVGYLYTSDQKYKGELRDDGVNNHQLILRPNITW